MIEVAIEIFGVGVPNKPALKTVRKTTTKLFSLHSEKPLVVL